MNRLSTFRASIHFRRSENRNDSFNISDMESPLKNSNPMDDTSGDFMQGNNMLAAAREEAKKNGYESANNYRLTLHRAGPHKGVGGLLAPSLPGLA